MMISIAMSSPTPRWRRRDPADCGEVERAPRGRPADGRCFGWRRERASGGAESGGTKGADGGKHQVFLFLLIFFMD